MLAVIALLGAVTPLRLQRPIAQREGWVSLLNVSSPFIHQDALGYLVGSLLRDSVVLIAKLGSSTFDLELFLVQNTILERGVWQLCSRFAFSELLPSDKMQMRLWHT